MSSSKRALEAEIAQHHAEPPSAELPSAEIAQPPSKKQQTEPWATSVEGKSNLFRKTWNMTKWFSDGKDAEGCLVERKWVCESVRVMMSGQVEELWIRTSQTRLKQVAGTQKETPKVEEAMTKI